MKRIFWIALLLLALLPRVAAAQVPAAAAEPAVDGWRMVQTLDRGRAIEVKKTEGHAVHCRFAGATDTALYCDVDRAFGKSVEMQMSRSEVTQVRLNQRKRNAMITIWTGVAGGFAWGAGVQASAPGNANQLPVVVGIAGAMVGAGAGAVLAAPVALLIPGKLVYQAPRATGP